MKPGIALSGVFLSTVIFVFVAYVQLRSLQETTSGAQTMYTTVEGNAVNDANPLVPSVIQQTAAGYSGARVEMISWAPRIMVVDNVMSPEECEELLRMAEPGLEKSTVVNVADGKSIPSSVRTSMGAFLSSHQQKSNPTLLRVEQRLAEITMLPPENGEALQVLRYEGGQYYRPHHDFFADEFNKKRGGQRVCTVLMYLTTPEEGGETVFPQAGGFGSKCQCGGKEVRGMSVKPQVGRAVIFWSQDPTGKEDPKSLHGGCEVIKGVKWSATKWIRSGKFV